MRKRKYKKPPKYRTSPQKGRLNLRCCISWLILIATILIGVALVISAYLFFPQRTNILLLGLDYTDPWNDISRTDTMILSTFIMPDGYVGLLSVPRDLWVSIPGIGGNRINTAHFFAESQQAGFGPVKAVETVEQNFQLDIDHYVRIRFEGFKEVVNAMGGLDIYLPEPMAGYPAGEHHLTGNKALAFARNRLGSDDFFRMARGQLVLKAIYQQMLKPANWIKIPTFLKTFSAAIDSDVPFWLWPRLIFSLWYTGLDGIDNKIITREMTTPYITDTGADVLLPRWEMIYPLANEMFGDQ